MYVHLGHEHFRLTFKFSEGASHGIPICTLVQGFNDCEVAFIQSCLPAHRVSARFAVAFMNKQVDLYSAIDLRARSSYRLLLVRQDTVTDLPHVYP